MKTFKLKDLINNRNKPKIVKKILDSIELSKLDKKDILNDLKSINKGGSADDGMLYFLIQKYDSSFGNFSSSDGILHLIETSSPDITTEIGTTLLGVKAFATSNIIIYITGQTCYEAIKYTLSGETGIDLSNTEYFKPITAEEYYSLVNK